MTTAHRDPSDVFAAPPPLLLLSRRLRTAEDVGEHLQGAGLAVMGPVRREEDAESLLQGAEPGVLVVDTQGDDAMMMLAMAERIRQRWPQAGVVVLAPAGSWRPLRLASEIGASGILLKPFASTQLVATVALSLCTARSRQRSRRIYLQALDLLGTVPDDAGPRSGVGGTKVTPWLTRREQEVIALLRRHRRPKEVAVELGISYHTVKNYLKRLFHKFGVASQAELLASVSSTGPEPPAGVPD